jgi:hypothetical protein
MSDAAIFAVGAVVSGVVLSGLVFTVLEVRRLGREATSKQGFLNRKNMVG